ncbi:phosphonate metabolism protein/1,5-bisphosphokinase (PRPP-forming) PhnN [Allopusillimonas ginsengisoli]|uniref:phosphonate metabolism protein/1,5-bisphosphokinase (PRPP-forming) PhnN n=1 Tax=Allopusillimonas ginsengisoli TaxID=453575 RepID=UPI001020D001|nr:phosphonate metabolism protein/1,5-bisphosphokinase (PRPP-forming) PhnN [Allopusillimonas ginsengisoli]TEA77273.1 phosphonate metabolism protein/1,5-bisphosphokinase (PRPP-forming) PhnN [Allopusillimonas ginsengisoli]
MPGRLVYLMGPSGAGKDTVLQGVLRLMGNQAFLAPRVITRDAHLAEAGALAVTEHEFAQMEAAGLLAMAWRAHGLAYGVLRHVNDRLAAGQDVFVNGSRAYLPTAMARYRDLVPVLLNVSPHLLRERLLRRGRESAAQIQSRLERNSTFHMFPESIAKSMLWIDNSGNPEEAVHALYRRLQQGQAEI